MTEWTMDIDEAIANLEATLEFLRSLQPALKRESVAAIIRDLAAAGNGKAKPRRKYVRRDRSAAGCRTTLTQEWQQEKAATAAAKDAETEDAHDGKSEEPAAPRTRKPRADRGIKRGPRKMEPEEKTEETAATAETGAAT
jgi:hypothetical protein